MLRALDVSYRAGDAQLLQEASLTIAPGRVHALLGPNGAGKSTLLKLLAGDLRPHSGAVALDARPLGEWSAGERARRRAVLPQHDSLRFGFTAEEVVALGRLPCVPSSREAEIVRDALEAAGVAQLRHRIYPTLSGGERARVQFARVMAQLWEAAGDRGRFLLLDEPTASLDLAHQHDCLRAARRFAESGAGVLVVLHDPNLALAYSDDATVLRAGRVLASGPTAATLTGEILSSAYGIEVAIHQLPGVARPLIWTRS
ncbi:MAG TPA: heme ABC transporter ATP-binding protein [Nevskiaceae bacterium]|nr:heme ABC transporter ATP-binding protein [Nevskiaceae bacterium]